MTVTMGLVANVLRESDWSAASSKAWAHLTVHSEIYDLF